MGIRYISEKFSAELIDHELAIEATSLALVAVTKPETTAFPPLIAQRDGSLNRISVKAATTGQLTGLKIGSYWPKNDDLNLPRHGSCIVLLDERTGRLEAIIESSEANSYRTAAANALAVSSLARADATRLAVFGAGHQAAYECEAIMKVRKISEIYVVNRSAERGDALARMLKKTGVEVTVSTPDRACKSADIIVTVTGARSPLFEPQWVRPGTHISCMGADAVGKQEVPVALLRGAALFCDEANQSLTIGEFQHVAEEIRKADIAPAVNLGDVLTGRCPGRVSDDSITVFDSSGLALQDLFLGACLLKKADRKANRTSRLDDTL